MLTREGTTLAQVRHQQPRVTQGRGVTQPGKAGVTSGVAILSHSAPGAAAARADERWLLASDYLPALPGVRKGTAPLKRRRHGA